MKAKTNRVFRVLRGSAFWFEFDDLRLTRHRGPPKSRNGYWHTNTAPSIIHCSLPANGQDCLMR